MCKSKNNPYFNVWLVYLKANCSKQLAGGELSAMIS